MSDDRPIYKPNDNVFFAFAGLERGRIVAYLGGGRYVIRWLHTELLVREGDIYGLAPLSGFWGWLKGALT